MLDGIDIQAEKRKVIKIYDESISKNNNIKSIAIIVLASVLTIFLYAIYMYIVFTGNNNLYFISLALLIIAYNLSFLLINPDKIKKDYSETKENKYNEFISGLNMSGISKQKQIEFYIDLFKLDNYPMNNYRAKFLKYLSYILGLITPSYKYLEVKFECYLTSGSFVVLFILIIVKIIHDIKSIKYNAILQYLRRRHFELKYNDIVSTKLPSVKRTAATL